MKFTHSVAMGGNCLLFPFECYRTTLIYYFIIFVAKLEQVVKALAYDVLNSSWGSRERQGHPAKMHVHLYNQSEVIK